MTGGITTRLTAILGTRLPIIQGGMRWASRAVLAAAVSEAGGLGMISAHTQPDAASLAREIEHARSLTSQPVGVNLTILAANRGFDYDALVATIIAAKVPVVETAGSNPANYLPALKAAGVRLIHKCTSVRHALKAEQLGVDAVTLVGFEGAGHPGEDDVPALVLLPVAARSLKLPVIACGGFTDGRGLVAALALGAEGIAMGTRFLLTKESGLHAEIKARMLAANERDTVLVGRSYRDSARVLRNRVVDQALEIEARGGATYGELEPLIGASRWMRAMEMGEVDGGAIPAGMGIGLIDDLPSCRELIDRISAQARDLLAGRLAQIAAL